jgi:polyhydroxybutyrate depolymerase
VCHIHGRADENVRFAGGIGRGRAKDSRAPVESVMTTWRSIDGCGPVSDQRLGPVRTQSACGGAGATVTLITVEGAAHQWPGSTPPPPRMRQALGIDPPSTALDATATLWEFFAAHPRAGKPM